MTFDFPALIRHAARTRPLRAGTIIGAGTASNRDASRGSCCIAERRVIDILDRGKATTPFLRHGDAIHIDVRDGGETVFGPIRQNVVVDGT